MIGERCVTAGCPGPKAATRRLRARPPVKTKKPVRGSSTKNTGKKLGSRRAVEPTVERVESRTEVGRRLVSDLLGDLASVDELSTLPEEIVDLKTADVIPPEPDELATELLVFDRSVLDEDEELEGVSLGGDDEPLNLDMIGRRAASIAKKSSTHPPDPEKRAPPRPRGKSRAKSRAKSRRDDPEISRTLEVIEKTSFADAKQQASAPRILVGRRLTEVIRAKNSAAGVQEIQETIERCRSCGHVVPSPLPVRCPSCNVRLKPRAESSKVCMTCGKRAPISAVECAKCRSRI